MYGCSDRTFVLNTSVPQLLYNEWLILSLLIKMVVCYNNFVANFLKNCFTWILDVRIRSSEKFLSVYKEIIDAFSV